MIVMTKKTSINWNNMGDNGKIKELEEMANRLLST
jgi:hypothetical protein